MNMSKWKDWRLNALTESSGDDENQDNNYITISESFYHLNSEAKLGFSIRQMRKHLTEIEKQFKRTVESGRTDESLVESWVRTYESLSQLDERLHGLLKSMYKKRK